MNEIFNKFLLAGDKFIPGMHLKQPAALGKLGFTYSVVDHLLKTKKEFKNLKKIQNIFTKMN